jgi:hypothetical protein
MFLAGLSARNWKWWDEDEVPNVSEWGWEQKVSRGGSDNFCCW